MGEVSLHHPTRGSGERRKLPQLGSGAEPRPKMDFMHVLGQKEAIWNTISVFLSDVGAPQTSWGPGKLSPLSPLSTGLPTQSRNFVKIRSQLFQLSDGQTNRQTDKQTEVKT